MSTKKVTYGSAREMLFNAIERSELTLESVAAAVGHKTHTAIWQYRTGKAAIPINSALQLGLACGMTLEEAQDFFMTNMKERDPVLFSAVTQIINSKVRLMSSSDL